MQASSIALRGRFALCALVIACSVHVSAGERSGPINDDNVEQPLSGSVRKYEHALLVSNSFIDMLRAGDYHTIHEELFDIPMKAEMDENRRVASEKDSE